MPRDAAAWPTNVAYYGRQTRSSLGWLVLSFFLGGVPLAVYLTTPHAPIVNLALAVALGLPTFVLSLAELGKSQAIVLNPENRRLRYVRGSFARRAVRELSYDQVRELRLTSRSVSTYRGGALGWWEIRIELSDGSEILLDEPSYERASQGIRRLGAALGISPLVDGKPLAALPRAAPPSLGWTSMWKAIAIGVFYGLGAIVIGLGLILAILRGLG